MPGLAFERPSLDPSSHKSACGGVAAGNIRVILFLGLLAVAVGFKGSPSHFLLRLDVAFAHDPGKGNALGLLVSTTLLVGWKSIGRFTNTIFSKRLGIQSTNFGEIFQRIVLWCYAFAFGLIWGSIGHGIQQSRRVQARQTRRWHWQTSFGATRSLVGIVSLLLLILSIVAVVPTIVAIPSTTRLELIGVATTHIDVMVWTTAHAPFDVESSKVCLEIVPGPTGPTAMTKKGPATNLNVKLVEVGGIVSSWLCAKGALAQDHMRVGGPGALDAGIPVVFGAILENRIRRNVDGIVVFTDKCGGVCFVVVAIGGHVPQTLDLQWILPSSYP